MLSQPTITAWRRNAQGHLEGQLLIGSQILNFASGRLEPTMDGPPDFGIEDIDGYLLWPLGNENSRYVLFSKRGARLKGDGPWKSAEACSGGGYNGYWLQPDRYFLIDELCPNRLPWEVRIGYNRTATLIELATVKQPRLPKWVQKKLREAQ